MTESRAWTFGIVTGLLVLVGVLAPRPIQAQTTAHRLCVFDTAAHRDTLVEVVSIRAVRSGDTAADPVITKAIGEMIQPRLQVPVSIGGLFYPFTKPPRTPPHAPPRSLSTVGLPRSLRSFGSIELAVARDGHFTRLRWLEPTGDSATDAAVLAAIRAAEAAGEGRDLGALMGKSSRAIRIELLAPDSVAVTAPLVRVRVPQIEVETAVVMRTPGPMVYPWDARRGGTGGDVELAYIVDEAGHAMPGSARIISAPAKEFGESAIGGIMTSTFFPARVAGCPVKMRVEQHVLFTIDHP